MRRIRVAAIALSQNVWMLVVAAGKVRAGKKGKRRQPRVVPALVPRVSHLKIPRSVRLSGGLSSGLPCVTLLPFFSSVGAARTSATSNARL